jgi:hypothetical protein
MDSATDDQVALIHPAIRALITAARSTVANANVNPMLPEIAASLRRTSKMRFRCKLIQ